MRARDNPFTTARIHQIDYQLPDLTWNDLMRRLEAMRFRGAIVGPEGSGKTTLLESLTPRLKARGFEVASIRLTRDEGDRHRRLFHHLPSAFDHRQILLFDGVEQLSAWTWWHLRWRTRRAGGLIVTAHQPGRLPTLLECRTSPDLLRRLIEDLLRGTMCSRAVDASSLFTRHRGNLRDALRELYDQWSVQPDAPSAECRA